MKIDSPVTTLQSGAPSSACYHNKPVNGSAITKLTCGCQEDLAQLKLPQIALCKHRSHGHIRD